MPSLRRSSMVLLLAVAAIFAAAPSFAQVPKGAAAAWPSRPVRFIIPLGAGSGVDITARLFADKLSQKWGQPVVVENKPGGDAMLAIMAVVNAHDDHVLLFAPASTFTAHPLLHEKLPYKADDLVPIARVTNTLIALGVPTALGVKSVKELAAKIKAEPGKLNYASVTGANDLLYAAFLKTEKLDMAKVPYKDPVTAINDLAEGRIQAFVGAYAIMRPRVQAGKVTVIALTNREHAKSLDAKFRPRARPATPRSSSTALSACSVPRACRKRPSTASPPICVRSRRTRRSTPSSSPAGRWSIRARPRSSPRTSRNSATPSPKSARCSASSRRSDPIARRSSPARGWGTINASLTSPDC